MRVAATEVTFTWDRFVAVADQVAPRFAQSVAPIRELVDSSILFSDGLCVVSLCELFGVEHLVEAGTGFGGSTEMFARHFQTTGSGRHIWSIDEAVNPRWQRPLAVLGIKRYSRYVWSTEKQAKRIARARLTPFSNVTLLRGDACVRLVPLVARLARASARIGVVLDGPKGDDQLRLAEQLLAASPQVTFVALDDVGPMFEVEGRYSRMLRHPATVFVTSDARFFERYSWVNAGRLPARMIANPDHTGYGMGVMVQAAARVS